MTKKKICGIVAAATALTLTAGVTFTLAATIPGQSAYAEEWNDVTLEGEYLLGSTLTVPARTVTVNGSAAEATAVLTFPDGTATVGTEAELGMTGLYTLTYSAFLNGKTYQTSENFRVYERAVSVGASSSVEYGRHQSSASTDGLIVRLAQNDTLDFSTIIDLREATASDPICELFVTPDRIGVLDFSKIIFTFTDIENSDCYLRVSAQQSGDGIISPNSYYLAGGNGQPMEGWEGSPWNKLHVNDGWGTPQAHSFYGEYYNGSDKLDHTKICVCYDAETKCVYAGGSRQFVIDLDSPQYFSKLWSGFESGKVRLSISADIYSGATANFVVSYVKDTDLAAERLTDAVAPEIAVDTDYTEMPVAKTGTAYKIPTATAKDDYSGICPVELGVYRNYTSPTPVSVPVADGTFTPTAEGRYAIVYRATDHEGNVANKILWVDAKQNVSAPVLTLPEDRVTSALAGTFVPVTDATASSGSGKLNISVRVIFGDEEVELEEGGFRPGRVGDFTVEYTASDYLGQTATERYTVTAERGDKPVFESEPVLPLYYLSGSEYAVPALIASDYTSGTLAERPATVTVTDLSGTREVSGSFTPAVLASGDKITLKFASGAAELVKEVPVIRPLEAEDGRMRIKMGNYFVSEGVSVVLDEERATVTATSANGGFVFANPLLAEGLTATLRGLPKKSSFDGLKIELADSLDRTTSVIAELLYANGKTSLRVNGEQIELAAGFHQSAETNTLGLGYADGAFSVGTASGEVTRTADGKAFNGFASGFVYLKISFIGAAEDAAYEITEINSQPVTNASSDRIRPKISLLGSYGDTVTLGERVVLRRGFAGDVLDPAVSFYLTVTDPEGNAVVSEDGVTLTNASPDREYIFVAERYGQYQVRYDATDTFSERTQTLGYVVLSEDRDVPVIEFNGTFPTEGKTGEAIVMPDFTVTDNVTAAENLIICKYVLTASGMLTVLPESSNSFRPTGAGEYTFLITALDEAGNYAMLQLVVTVTE